MFCRGKTYYLVTHFAEVQVRRELLFGLTNPRRTPWNRSNIIGTGFGASVAITKLLEKRPNATIHMLERGLWWFTPEEATSPYC